MATSNEAIFDAAVRHQVNLQRLSKGEAKKILRMLEKSDKELVALITKRAEGLSTDFTTARWQAMRKEIARTRSAVIRSVGGEIGDTMQDLAVLEQDITKLALQRAVPVEVNFATTSPAALRSLAQDSPFGGADQVRTLAEWMTNLEQADQGRITSALQAGVQNGETIPQITRRVQNAAELTQQNAEAISRTGVNHISNAAREEFFKENDDVILALRWVSTLDGRTSAICRARDGHFALPEGSSRENVPSPAIQGSPVRPPAHLRCRSLMVAVLDSDAVADSLPERPTVRDTRTGRQREHDFRKDARAKAGDDWKGMSREERNEAIRDVRRDWAKERVGHVPGETTYDEWLRRQDEAFQNEVLGPTKAKKFREGLEMDQFVDRSGNELTVTQLKEKTPPASKASTADREITKARDVDAKAKRAEQRAATARKREEDARKAAEKHEADAKRLREEQAAQKKEARDAAAERKAEQERKAREAREKKAEETKAKREAKKKAAAEKKAKEEARTKKAKEAAEKKRIAKEKAAKKKEQAEAKARAEVIAKRKKAEAAAKKRLAEDKKRTEKKAAEARKAAADKAAFDARRKAAEEKARAEKLAAEKKAAEKLKVDRDRFFTDEKYARSQPAKVQDELLGPERGEFLRRGAPIHTIADTRGKLVSIDSLVEEYPRDIRQKGQKWTPEKQDKWSSGLITEEKNAIDVWADDASLFQNMQDQRRLGINLADTFTDDQINALDTYEAALKRAPVYDGEVWRGLSLTDDVVDDIVAKGIVRFDTDQSASVLATKAWDFANLNSRTGKGKPVMWRIRKQTNGKMIMDQAVEAEAEVVLRKGTSYRVVKSYDEGRLRIIELEEI